MGWSRDRCRAGVPHDCRPRAPAPRPGQAQEVPRRTVGGPTAGTERGPEQEDGMIWLHRRGISSEERDRALAASGRHAAFADSAGVGGGQARDELRMIAERADQHLASRALGDLRPKRRHPMLWKTAWGVTAVCIAVVAAGVAAKVGASALNGLRDSGQQGLTSIAASPGVAAVMVFVATVRVLLSPAVIELLAQG